MDGTRKDTEDTTLVQSEELERAIRALPFVTKLSPVGARNSHGHAYQVSLRCPSCEEYGSCGKKQEPPVQVSSRHPTLHACLQELLKRLQEKHGKCAEALTQKAAADAQAAAAVHTPSVLEAMMLFQQAKKHAQAAQDRAKAAQDQVKAAKKVALEAEKDNDAAQKELQELQRVMEPKRARTNATTANDHEECDEQSSGDMDITDYRREAARIQKRRSVVLGSREDVPTPQKGQAGPLEHPRLGLVGWIAYWSLGNCALAVKIIVGLIRKLNLTEGVFETLTPITTKRETETNAKIVMLMKAGLAETKHCRNEQHRQEFHIGLSYVMPPREGSLSGRKTSSAWSKYKESGGAGSRVGCQGLALGEARCVGLCAGSGAMVH